MMEGCLLCLELNKDFVERISISSKEWFELDVINTIEKHFWAMNHIKKNSWLCGTCWREVHNFQKFYMRIEEAHIDFGILAESLQEKGHFYKDTGAKTVQIKLNTIDEVGEIPIEELKSFLNDYDLSNDHLENDIIEKPLVKDELKDVQGDDIILVQKRKRGRPRKDDPNTIAVNKAHVNKTEKCRRKSKDVSNGISEIKSSLNKTKQRGKNKSIEIPATGTEENELKDFENSEIKKEPMMVGLAEETNISVDNRDSDTDSNNDSDLESFEHNKGKSSSNILPPKTNHKEKDKFLSENFKITCFLCNIALETFFAMVKHFEENHNERGHVKCCNKKFYRRSVLVDHVHRHLNPDYFKCNQCGKVMADRRCLELHIESHSSIPQKNKFCDICGKGFVKLGVLKKHRLIHLSEAEKQYPCTECGKNFGTNYLRASHYRSVHLKKYRKICDICGKAIRCKDVFERHMLQHEGKTAPTVSCDVCGLRLTDNKALKRHKDMIHPEGGKQEYTCSICSKISPNLKAHKRHVQYKHIMGYDHKCAICDKSFKRAQTLREHMASHTGTILYTCPWCPKTFNSNANMHNHRKKVHPKEWVEASRKRYSGNLPPNYKPPATFENSDFTLPLDL